MKKRPAAILSVNLLSGVVILLAAHGIVRSVLSAPRFRVDQLEVSWGGAGAAPSNVPAERYRLLPPRSIFQVDLAAVAGALQRRYPAAELEEVRRILPNRLVATLRPRRVVAQLRAAGRYYAVSQDGTVVAVGQPSPWPHLPILLLEDLKGPFRVGQTLDHPSFWGACELLAMIRRQGGVAGHALNSIRGQRQALTATLDSGLEIRFSADQMDAEWQRLMELIAQKGDLLGQARYLDVRFEDPVIGK
ncbi:MAG: hypothetical protein HYZ93_06050 [Candidatus Omnitrophica bacterium]|nr:hypothetical protein [Candidatus Omnitrophota bacterium]